MKVLTLALAFLALAGGAEQSPRRTPATGPIGAEPIEVLNAEKAWSGADTLLPLARHPNPAVRSAAVRALGRLEDPRLVPTLLGLEDIPADARFDAVAQSLTGFNPELGQSLAKNSQLGQIDSVADLKLTLQVDEYYLARFSSGRLPFV